MSCFKLENSKLCPEYNGHYIFKRVNLTNSVEFEAQLKKYLESDDSFKTFLTEIFKCNNKNLPDFRYRRSFLCNHYSVLPSVASSLCESQIAEDKNANRISFCYSSCIAAINSLEELLMNTSNNCSQEEFQKRFNGFKTNCSSGQSFSNNQCFLGTDTELKYCGYNNENDKNNFCKQDKAMTEPCCANNYKPPNPLYTKGEGDSNGNIPIILFSITVLVSTVLTVLFYFYKKRKNGKKDAGYQRQNDYNKMTTKLPFSEEGEERRNSSSTVASSENKLFYVFHEYIPVINDEIQLNVGDIVKVTKIFDDGWAYGTNISTECVGALPLACCTEYRASISSMMLSYAPPFGPVNHRDSSLLS